MPHRPIMMRIGELLTEREEKPDLEAILRGTIPVVAKIGFDTGKIELRAEGKTKTGMILIRPGDLVVSGINIEKGAVAIYDEKRDLPAAATIHYSSYLIDKKKGDSLYLWYFLRSDFFRKILASKLAGGIKTEVKAQKLLSIVVPLPSLEEQRRIVSRIESLLTRIESAKYLRKNALEEVRILFDLAMLEIFNELATTYELKPLDTLISMTSGENLKASQMDDSMPYPVYGGGGLVGRYDHYLVGEPKIVIGRVGARCGCVFVTEGKSWITDNALYLTKISDEVDRRYLVYALRNLDLRRFAKEGAQPVVSQGRINSQAIPKPPIEIQRRVVTYLDCLETKVDELRKLQDETRKYVEELALSVIDGALKCEE